MASHPHLPDAAVAVTAGQVSGQQAVRLPVTVAGMTDSKPITAAEAEQLLADPKLTERVGSCARCGRWFLASYFAKAGNGPGYARFCSDECASPSQKPGPRRCDNCGRRYNPTRADQRYCAPRCRIAAHRAGS